MHLELKSEYSNFYKYFFSNNHFSVLYFFFVAAMTTNWILSIYFSSLKLNFFGKNGVLYFYWLIATEPFLQFIFILISSLSSLFLIFICLAYFCWAFYNESIFFTLEMSLMGKGQKYNLDQYSSNLATMDFYSQNSSVNILLSILLRNNSLIRFLRPDDILILRFYPV